jgi:hypothetical protein
MINLRRWTFPLACVSAIGLFSGACGDSDGTLSDGGEPREPTTTTRPDAAVDIKPPTARPDPAVDIKPSASGANIHDYWWQCEYRDSSECASWEVCSVGAKGGVCAPRCVKDGDCTVPPPATADAAPPAISPKCVLRDSVSACLVVCANHAECGGYHRCVDGICKAP